MCICLMMSVVGKNRVLCWEIYYGNQVGAVLRTRTWWCTWWCTRSEVRLDCGEYLFVIMLVPQGIQTVYAVVPAKAIQCAICRKKEVAQSSSVCGVILCMQCSVPHNLQDGSCNGLQHYAALARDYSGAVAVNLVPSSSPQDVYSAVSRVGQVPRSFLWWHT